MNIFTDVYNKSRDLLKNPKFDKNWDAEINQLKLLFAVDGPDSTKAKVLDEIRAKLKENKSWYQFTNPYMAKEIVEASQTNKTGFQERCAFLKTMRHFYFVSQKGSQSIWIVDGPKKYKKWSYDQLKGLTKTTITTKLQQSGEVFGEDNRTLISDSLQLARKWCSQVEVALAKKDDAVKTKVKRWFHEDGASDADVNSTIAKLSTGFKSMHAACNSGKVIFSDRPHLRTGGSYDSTYASVNSGDKMPIIYIYELFLKTGKRNFFGNVPKMWLCALTVVHELSHKLANTDDIHYDTDGLKPGSNGFTAANAQINADSWAYFAADVVNALSKGTIKDTLK